MWKTDRLHYKTHDIAPGFLGRKIGISDPINSVELYHGYNDWVRREASKRGRQVLEWKVGEGYGPICRFLGKDVPQDAQGNEAKFPRINDQRTMSILKAILLLRGTLSWVALGATVWAVWKYGAPLALSSAKALRG